MTEEKKKTIAEEQSQIHEEEAAALQAANQQKYDNLNAIISDVENRLAAAQTKDEAAQRRENAFRYISGVGDTLAGLANLVGTAHGAANQKQSYSSHAVVQKAEEARKARKLEMDDLNKRLDEMRMRDRELRAAGSLAEAELKARQAKERFAEQVRQEEIARKKEETEAARRFQAEEAQKTRDYQAAEAEKTRRHQASMNNADNASSERVAQARLNSTAQGKGEEFDLGDGEFVKIPESRINEYNLVEWFDMVPDDIKETAGKPKMDAYGNIVGYYPPTQREMLRAIERGARRNPAIKDVIRRAANIEQKATETPAKVDTAAPRQSSQNSKKDWSHRKRTATPTPASSEKNLGSIEDDILKNDSVYINGTRYAKL